MAFGNPCAQRAERVGCGREMQKRVVTRERCLEDWVGLEDSQIPSVFFPKLLNHSFSFLLELSVWEEHIKGDHGWVLLLETALAQTAPRELRTAPQHLQPKHVDLWQAGKGCVHQAVSHSDSTSSKTFLRSRKRGLLAFCASTLLTHLLTSRGLWVLILIPIKEADSCFLALAMGQPCTLHQLLLCNRGCAVSRWHLVIADLLPLWSSSRLRPPPAGIKAITWCC